MLQLVQLINKKDRLYQHLTAKLETREKIYLYGRVLFHKKLKKQLDSCILNRVDEAILIIIFHMIYSYI